MNGVIVIDKPGGMTSHDVVARVRKSFGTSKAGHLGTLDPMATGVLPVCLGKATRIARFLPSSPKEYIGQIRFGYATTTYDREGEPTTGSVEFRSDTGEILDAMSRLTGRIDQVPPPYSAKKIGGVRSYRLARRGERVENRPVPVEVYSFELTGLEQPLASFRVTCSSGTYIRSLAHDLGQMLGCGAHLESLRRLRSGTFGIDQAQPLDELSEAGVIPIEQVLSDWPTIEASVEDAARVGHGNRIPVNGGTNDGALDGRLARIFNKQGEFIAIAAVESGWAHPEVVLTSIASVEEEV